ncbi:MAG: CRISPR-associated helicase Cas3' [Nitrososphaerota archaeon]
MSESLALAVFRDIFKLSTPYGEQLEHFRSVWGRAEAGEAPATVLKMPTGYGKTEALISPYLAQVVSRNWTLAPRLIYTLPTQALCNQMLERILCYVDRVNEQFGSQLKCDVQHGGRSADPYLMSDIVVTTFDQLLYGYARCMKHMGDRPDIPAGSISLSYVVLDEAHMYSPYTQALIRALFEIFSASAIPVALATATMPQGLLKQMIERIPQAVLIQFKGTNPLGRTIHLSVVDGPLLREGQLGEWALEALKEADNALVVCNTVDAARTVYKQLEKRLPDVHLIHSRFKPSDKRVLEQNVVSVLGKQGTRRGVVVSTQVCEAGLDISADTMLTECAPADSLVQRSGRCARWKGMEGKLFVAKPASFAPYEPSYVKATWDFLTQHQSLDLANWQETITFLDILPYSVDEIAASEALNELYEATLYAESRPEDLSAREEAFVTVALSDPPRSEESVNVPFAIAEGNPLFAKGALETDSRGIFLLWDFSRNRR